MSTRHFKELENALNESHWLVVDRVDREDFCDPCYWVVARPDGTAMFKILFSADPDKDEQTMLDSFAADADLENTSGLYFARGASWTQELRAFVNEINAVNTP